MTSTRSGDPLVVRGVQLPTPNANEEVFEGVGQSNWMMLAESEEEYALVAEISEMEALEPCSLAKAKSRPDWPLWKKAIEEELALLKAAGTWKLVNAPEGANIVGSKWVFQAKKDASGNHQESGHFLMLLLLSLFFLILPYAVEKGEIRRAKGIQSFPFSPYGKKAE